jgi:hypothetical protein
MERSGRRGTLSRLYTNILFGPIIMNFGTFDFFLGHMVLSLLALGEKKIINFWGWLIQIVRACGFALKLRGVQGSSVAHSPNPALRLATPCAFFLSPPHFSSRTTGRTIAYRSRYCL